VIQWTHDNGSDHHDPSVLVWFVGRDGKVFSRFTGGRSASMVAKWLDEELKKYEKEHPRTAVPFEPAECDEKGKCAVLDEAREQNKPVLLYFGREPGEKDKGKIKTQVKKCRKFEKGALSSKKAASVARGWVLLRFDVSKPAHAKLLEALGLKDVPMLVMYEPGSDKPVHLGASLRGANLAYHLAKFSDPPKPPAKK